MFEQDTTGFKGDVLRFVKILSIPAYMRRQPEIKHLWAHPHVVPNLYDFLSCTEHMF